MRRVLTVLLALIAVVLAGWFAVRALTGRAPHIGMISIALDGIKPLPDTPDEWHGRIDYRTLDRQLTTLSQRPEMAGLAVAVIEEGELRFVRAYGVVDR